MKKISRKTQINLKIANYEKAIKYFEDMPCKNGYISDTKLDWEALSHLRTSFDSLKTIKFDDIEDPSATYRIVAWIVKQYPNKNTNCNKK